jgi:hypothetical protein
MISWVALILSFFAFAFATAAFMFSVYTYFNGSRVKELDPDELFDLLLEQNDTNVIFKERPFDD